MDGLGTGFQTILAGKANYAHNGHEIEAVKIVDGKVTWRCNVCQTPVSNPPFPKDEKGTGVSVDIRADL